MQINSTVNQAINKQIGMEFSAYLQYLTISTNFDVEGLSELASFFKTQTDDEIDINERYIELANFDPFKFKTSCIKIIT